MDMLSNQTPDILDTFIKKLDDEVNNNHPQEKKNPLSKSIALPVKDEDRFNYSNISSLPVAPGKRTSNAAIIDDVHKQLLKTKICKLFLEGRCNYGKKCYFAHTSGELRHQPNLRKTTLCKAFSVGECTLSSEKCRYAHGNDDLRSTNQVFKTVLCQWYKKGFCQHGEKCRFAHGKHELSRSSSSQTTTGTDTSSDSGKSIPEQCIETNNNEPPIETTTIKIEDVHESNHFSLDSPDVLAELLDSILEVVG